MAPSPGAGPKGQISFNFNYKVNFKVFFILNFVCVNDTKHIRRDLHYVAWVMPQGWDIGALGCPGGGGGKKHGHVAYQIDGNDEQNRMQVKFLS